MKLSLILLISLLTPSSFAGEPSPRHACFPRSPDSVTALNAQEMVSETERQSVMRSLGALYSQDISARGVRLDLFEADVMDFGAFASRETAGVAAVKINKGTRFHKFITKDSYTLIVCHELGHHLGGQPLSRTGTWATVEGGADYFGNLKCMRRFLESLPSNELFAQPAPALELIAKCQARFSSANEVQICGRSLAAARQLGMVLSDLSGIAQTEFPSLEGNDLRVVERSLESHPQPQCRLDTYRAAALCPVPSSEELKDEDALAGACHTQRNPADQRPACWYAAPVDAQLSFTARAD